MSEEKVALRFFFEWGGGCLWPGNDAAYRDLEFGPYDLHDPCPLPLSTEILERCERMSIWHDTSLNWDYPPDPGPWRQPECNRFNAEADELLSDIRQELGSEFEVIDHRVRCEEDPDLDLYLADPKGFSRNTD